MTNVQRSRRLFPIQLQNRREPGHTLAAKEGCEKFRSHGVLPNHFGCRLRWTAYCINTGMRDTRDLTDQQWKILDHLIPEPARRSDGRGRPWKDRRAVLNGILWVLPTGAPWAELPDRYIADSSNGSSPV